MDADERDATSKGVYFAACDYAGFWRRGAALVVDLAGLLFLGVVHHTVLVGVLDASPSARGVSAAALIYLYLTWLKRSRIRTPGYWATGLRIVDLRGRPPSMFRMTMRLLWWVMGPINPILDYVFLTNDDRSRTIRDKLMGTYVVRRDAHPAGVGHETYHRLGFMGFMLLYPVVRRDHEARPE